MESVRLKKDKILNIKIFAAIFIVIGIVAAFENLTGIFILLIGVLLVGINVELEIFSIDKSRLQFTFLNKRLFSIKQEVLSPNYISLFGQSFSKSNDFSAVAALGSSSAFDFYVIRFFDENNRNEIVFKSKNKAEVLQKGKQLAELLNVDLLNKLEN